MEDECEFKFNNLCFNPKNAKNGILAVPCEECNSCYGCHLGQQESRTEIIPSPEETLKIIHEITNDEELSQMQEDLVHINQEQPSIAESE